MFQYKGRKMAVASSNTDLHGYGEAIRTELARRIPAGRKLKVLDVGTGFGINAAFLAGRLPKGSEVWTVDPSKGVLDKVKESLGERSGIRFKEASADDLGFEDGHFDAVVSVMVLHHLAKLQPALREMMRVVRPGGILVLVDYKPEASHELEFKSLHKKKDFFKQEVVAEQVGKLGVTKSKDYGLWYLVEASKPSARRPRAARGGARPKRAG